MSDRRPTDLQVDQSEADPIADAAERRRALDAERSFIVQAPAGSGKTELLTQRYLRLLATVEHPEQVLAITFTRKAAAEMRNRVLLAIAAADAPPPESVHKRNTWELARAARDTDRQRGWRLAEHPSRLRIQTIDALNAMLARRLPVLAGTGAAVEPSDDALPLYEAACERLILRLGDGSRESASLERLIVHLGNRVDRLIGLLTDLLAKRDQWLHPVVRARASADLRTTLEQALRAIVERHLHQVCAALGETQRRELWELTMYAAANLLADEGIAAERRTQLAACVERTAAPGTDCASLDAWQTLADVFFKGDGELYRKVDKRHGFPPADKATKARMVSALANLAAEEAGRAQLFAVRSLPQPRYHDAQWRTLEALLVVLPVAVVELQAVFQSRGQADYVEAALRALQALGPSDEPTDLALAFDYRLRHILVDEFQDTSFAQLDLLERLTAGWSYGDGRTLFCVGDPMQSIYRFRQAEVGLFLELQRAGLRNLPLERLTLSANFRSTRPIIAWVNRVFPAVLAPGDDPEQGAVKYSPSVAAIASAEGGVQVHPAFDNDALSEARRVVGIVQDALAGDADSTVAVLVTARTHVERIAAELTRVGVDFNAVEIERLRDRPVVQDLIALTRALVHLADRTAWLAVLRAPWCGLTLADLHAVAADHPESTIHQLLAQDRPLSGDAQRRIARVRGVLDRAIAQRGRYSLRDWVERTWNALGGPATLGAEQDLEDAAAFFRRLDQIGQAGDLEDVVRLEEQLANLFANPRADSAARVDVMTIHKAKGLEFDTVILPGLHRRLRGEDRELLRWTRIAGLSDGIVFAPIKAEGAQPDPVYRWVELLEKDRSLRERGRLLYVAATRAKRHLHLLGSLQTKQKGEETTLAEPLAGTMLNMLWPEVRERFEQTFGAHAGTNQFAAIEAGPSSLRRLPSDWQVPAADASLQHAAPPPPDLASERPPFDWVSETGRHVGTLVHRELDRMTRTGQLGTERLRQPAARARLLAELAELGVPPDLCEAAGERVASALEQILADERGRWLLGMGEAIRDAESELALSGIVNGKAIDVVMDRTFVAADGTRWIVDFKTSTHEGGGLDRFLDAEVARYRGQLARYARLMRMFRPDEPVKAALYFPLLRQWREVPE